jgi:hypothetical protein
MKARRQKVIDPIKHVEPKGIKPLITKLEKIERRLVDFSIVRAQVIAQWRAKAAELDAEGKVNESYVITRGCEIVESVEPRVAYIKLSDMMKRNKMPLLRDHYRRIRSDVLRLKKIALDHKRAAKIRKEMEDINGRRLQAGKEADGILPKEPIAS